VCPRTGVPRVPSSIAPGSSGAAGQNRRWNATPRITPAASHAATIPAAAVSFFAQYVDTVRGGPDDHGLVGGVRCADADQVQAETEEVVGVARHGTVRPREPGCPVRVDVRAGD
jgi:hypothetical protein